MNVTAVAQPRAAKTKNSHGCRIERGAEHFFAAVLRDECLNDLVVRFAFIDERRQLGSHLVRGTAWIFPALGNGGVPAGTTGADDFVLKLLLEVVSREIRRLRLA